ARQQPRDDRDRPPARRQRRADRAGVPALDRRRRGGRRGRRPWPRARSGAAARAPVRPARFGHGCRRRTVAGRLGPSRGDTGLGDRSGDADGAGDGAGGVEADPVIRRIISAALVLWVFGFLWFAIALPQPAGAQKTDAIVVPTGGVGRIPRGLAMLRARAAPRMLVTGVDAEVRPREFAAEY